MTNRLEEYFPEEWCPRTHGVVVTSDLVQDGGSLCYHDVAVYIASSRAGMERLIRQALEHANLVKAIADLSEEGAQELAGAIETEMTNHLFCTQRALVQELRSLALFS